MHIGCVRVPAFYGINLDDVLIAQESNLEQKLGKKIQKILKYLQLKLLETEYHGTLPDPAPWAKQYFNKRRMVVLFQRLNGTLPKTPQSKTLAPIQFGNYTEHPDPNFEANSVELDFDRKFTEEYLNNRK